MLAVGIATGLTYLGRVGPYPWRQERLVGRPVNMAAHLCNASKRDGGRVLLCPDTGNQLLAGGWTLEEAKSGISAFRLKAAPTLSMGPTSHLTAMSRDATVAHAPRAQNG